jgi:hypothetical protein
VRAQNFDLLPAGAVKYGHSVGPSVVFDAHWHGTTGDKEWGERAQRASMDALHFGQSRKLHDTIT